jgi:hypothetical protein
VSLKTKVTTDETAGDGDDFSADSLRDWVLFPDYGDNIYLATSRESSASGPRHPCLGDSLGFDNSNKAGSPESDKSVTTDISIIFHMGYPRKTAPPMILGIWITD